MKNIAIALVVVVLAASNSAFALDLSCSGNGENFTINAQADKIVVGGGYGELSRETQDPDCVYRSNRYDCYEEGQLMINIPLALANGTAKKGTVYIQSDTGDNADSQNHALLGAPYDCVAE